MLPRRTHVSLPQDVEPQRGLPIQAEFELSDTQVGQLTGLAFAVLNVALGVVVARYAERGRRMSLIAVGSPESWVIVNRPSGELTGNSAAST